MAKPIDIGINALVSFVSGTGGAAIHFLGFKSLTGTQFGVPTRSLIDIIIGLVSVAAATMWERGPDWVKTVLMLLGGTLCGLGVAEWAKWTAPPAPAPLRAPYMAPAPRITTAPTIF